MINAEISFNNFESNSIFPIMIQFMNIHVIRGATIQLAWTLFKEHNWSTVRQMSSIYGKQWCRATPLSSVHQEFPLHCHLIHWVPTPGTIQATLLSPWKPKKGLLQESQKTFIQSGHNEIFWIVAENLHCWGYSTTAKQQLLNVIHPAPHLPAFTIRSSLTWLLKVKDSHGAISHEV